MTDSDPITAEERARVLTSVNEASEHIAEAREDINDAVAVLKKKKVENEEVEDES